MLEVFRSPRRAMVWLVEATLLATLVSFAAGLLRGEDDTLTYALFVQALGVSIVVQASLYYHGLYSFEPLATGRLFLTTLRAVAVAALVLLVVFWLLPRSALD